MMSKKVQQIVNESKRLNGMDESSLGFCRMYAIPKNIRLNLFLVFCSNTKSQCVTTFHRNLKDELQTMSEYEYVTWLTNL